MATHLIRYELAGKTRWGVVRGTGIVPLEGNYPTTAALIDASDFSKNMLKRLASGSSPDSIMCWR